MTERTILVTTHQVEEVENLFTDVLFIRRGQIVLDAEVESLAARFAQVMVAPDRADAARALNPFHEREVFGRRVMTFEGRSHDELAALGEVRTPSIADLFVARMQESRS